MTQNTRDISLDILKLLCALLVCNIHFPLSYSTGVFCDVAVPIFFILSGYFMEKSSQKYNLTKLKSKHTAFFVKSLIVILAVFGFQLICNLIMHNTVGMISHLWYLSALVEINLLYYLSVKFNFKKAIYFFIFPLLFLNLSLGFYAPVMIATPPLSSSVLESSLFLRVSRNALFEGLPFYFMGSFIYQYINQLKRPWAILLIIIGAGFAVLQVYETRLAAGANIAGGGHIYISTIIASALIVIGVANLHIKSNFAVPNSLSYWIYILHFPLGKLLGQFVAINSIVIFILSTLVALLICYLAPTKTSTKT